MTDPWWSNDRLAQAKALYAEGLTYSQIGRYLGCSKNKVIGKLTRMGIAGSAGSMPRHSGHQPKQSPTCPRSTKTSSAPVPAAVVTLEPLGPPGEFPPPHTCRFTYDDITKPGWRMCGRKAKPSESWCEDHHRVVYTQAQFLGRSNKALQQAAKQAEAASGCQRIFG